MPLRDHFRPPLGHIRGWHSFHSAWAAMLSFELNRLLPEGYFADPTVQFGIEIDVATFEPPPTLTLPMTLITDVVEVAVFDRQAGPVLVGAIELVSPANKDRPAHRDAFVSKCASYLQRGVGLIVVDVVTDRRADLHSELLQRLNHDFAAAPSPDLWAGAYRPIAHEEETGLQIWHESLRLGQPLPTLPLWLKNGPCMRLDLEATYEKTCHDQRIAG